MSALRGARYARMFERLGQARQGAFIPFVMLGDPDTARSLELIRSLAGAGADALELGLPFSDPIADGPVIQASADRALRAGTTPAVCFRLLREFRARHPHVPVGILTYANLVLAGGRDAFYGWAAQAGVDSILIADVPLLEARPFVAAARDVGVAPVLIAAANTPAERLGQIAGLGGGYTYCVARAGVTGADEKVRFDHRAMLEALMAHRAPPPIFGFGIARPAHVEAALAAGAAGVISGSAIVSVIAAGQLDRLPAFVAELKAATVRRKAA